MRPRGTGLGRKEETLTETMNASRSATSNRNGALIAWWAWLLAIAAFAFAQYVMNVLVVREPNPPPAAFRVFIGLIAGSVLGGLMLWVGYVHNDAARRGMNKWLWTAIVFFVPNGIGFILYFLTRKPMLVACAHCGLEMPPTYRFCPKCATPRQAVCGHCGTPIQPGDLYCNNCGRMLHEPLK